ncbi:1580_t:CDS:2 [Acaulospora morrowiae]|uniref:1580_t:CDS:1 n=1 Tax=Acaulospora morrowiae TaxID=94023 RepID=A0A9N9DKJ9_9GLOM|nr:1580_t:CDS:2 [Acaulospora morrowiae]
MSKLMATTIGLITSSALLYSFQSNIENNTSQIRGNESNISPTKPNNRPQLPVPSIAQTKNYINHRLIPTFKSTWNEHIETFAHKVCNFDASETAKTAVNNAKSFVEDKRWK